MSERIPKKLASRVIRWPGSGEPHQFKPMRLGAIGSSCQWCGMPGTHRSHILALLPARTATTEAAARCVDAGCQFSPIPHYAHDESLPGVYAVSPTTEAPGRSERDRA